MWFLPNNIKDHMQGLPLYFFCLLPIANHYYQVGKNCNYLDVKTDKFFTDQSTFHPNALVLSMLVKEKQTKHCTLQFSPKQTAQNKTRPA